MSAPDPIRHPIRPCAEFPNDNTDLHAGSRWVLDATSTVVKPLLPEATGVSFQPVPLVPVLAPEQPRADSPEATIAVLDEQALETTTPAHDDCAHDASLPLPEVEEVEEVEEFDPFVAALAPFVEQWAPVASSSTYVEETPTQQLRPLHQAVQPLAPLHFELTPLPAQVSEWSELVALLTDYLLTLGHTRASALIGPLLNGELVDLSRLERPVIDQLQRDGVASLRGSRVVSSASFRSSAHVFREELANGGLDANEALFWLTDLVGALMGGEDEHEVLEARLRELGIARLLERAA